ncbi:MAG: bifunctional 2-polyprenyl-6-hydroxyphenol methylase/3-demethylubiquinol 3-O-methyltransferase UbiG [Rhizobiales bacterium]|nr:bifunctional 2-polyprenyl-6-hydroxyphenol methylase/3-demethylubiquinol 3-O-methyltransferase UbiG [Hyphomicrobiales bacterium]
MNSAKQGPSHSQTPSQGHSSPEKGSSIDPADVARFSAIAAEWWDPAGKFRPLHKFNPVRLTFIRERVLAHFSLNAGDPHPFKGLRFLDIGCGGGLLCEPMTRLGADVLGADASERNITTASVHAAEQDLTIDYRATTAEALAEAGERFDVILNMEVIEHVANRDQFLKDCASMLKPGGIMFVATLNRTLKAHALAIIGAEYVLGWLPRGTHQWSQFVTIAEMEAGLAESKLKLLELTGVSYSPFTDKWSLSKDTDVNYMAVAEKPAS